MPATPSTRKARAYTRMAGQAHARGDNDLGNYFGRKAQDIERTTAHRQARAAKRVAAWH